MSAPLPPTETVRLEALRHYDVLDTPPEQAFDDLTRLAAQICSTPISAVTLLDADRQWFKSIVGLAVMETPRDLSFCAHVILEDDILLIPDAAKDGRFADHPFVTGEPRIRFYAGVPLITPEGHAVGALCVLDTVPRQLGQDQQDALHRLGRQAIALLEARPEADKEALSRWDRQQDKQKKLILAAATVRQDAENLKISEERFRRLFEAAKDGILILDAASGKIEDVNPYLCELLDYTPDDFVDKQLWEIGTFHDIAASQDAFRTLQETEYIRYDDLPLKNREGRIISVEFVSNVYWSGDKKVIQCNIRNISQRKEAQNLLRQSEANLRAAQQIAHLGSWELDLSDATDIDSNPLHWSDEIFYIFGYRPGEIEVSNENFFRAVHPDDRNDVRAAVAQALQGDRLYNIDHRIILPNGAERIVHEQASLLRDKVTGAPLKMIGTVQDVTERKEIEETSARLAAIVETSDDAIISKTLDGIITTWNSGAQKLYGYTPQEAIGHSVTFLAPPDLPDEMPHLLESIRNGVPVKHYETERVHKDGSHLDISLSISPLKDVKGNIVGASSIKRDITARKRAEVEAAHLHVVITEQSQLLSTILANVPGLVFEAWGEPGTDAHRENFVSEYLETMLGYSVTEWLATPNFWLDIIHPDDRDQTMKAVKSNYAGGQGGTVSFRWIAKDGHVVWVEAKVVIVCDEAGHPLGARGVVMDITARKQAEELLQKAYEELESRVAERTAELERVNAALHLKEEEQLAVLLTLRQSEERFRLLVESVHDYEILMMDNTGHVLTWNVGAERMKGYRAEEIIGRHFSCFYTEEDKQASKPEQELRIAETQGYLDDEGWRVRQDGSRFWATVVITAIRDESGELRGFAKITRDITERKNVEAALHEAKAQADAANLAKSEFLSRMSHELRTPLNAILGFGQILNSVDLGPLEKESVGYILKGGAHLLGLINEVLDIARVEAGHIDLSLEPIALDEVVPEACALVRPLAAERSIRLTDNTSQLAGCYILADHQRLKQVLINLLSNAIKYNREAGQVEVFCTQNSDGWTTVAVIDTGPGISDLDMPKLFMPFERLGAGASNVEGTGLGLALSQRLAIAMGGTLTVESAMGQGTTFTLAFSQATSPEEQLTNVPSDVHHLGVIEADTRSYSILCIEDNPSNLRLIEVILKSRPEITLLAAIQGSIGIDLARQHQPDLILLDLNLPDIHGSEVLIRLQESGITREIPVVVVSADATSNQIERLLEAGAKAYLTKPLDVGQFLDTINKFLRDTPEVTTPTSP